MAIDRLPKDRWSFKWSEHDLKKIDDRSTFFMKTGAIDEYSAWSMAEQEYYHNTRNCAGFMVR